MPTNPRDEAGPVPALEDPRVSEEFLRSIPADDDGDEAVLVGVVHDHPASVHRVRAVAGRVDPAVVALELPPLAVPLFERRGRRRGDSPVPESGDPPLDEMSAAVAAAGDARVVGIDAFGRRFIRRLLGAARREDASLSTLGRAAQSTVGVVRHALACRLAARRSPADADELAASFDHGAGPSDPPAAQASDERTQVARSRTLLGAVERPHADRLVDDAREATMAAGVADLREEGPVLAVVGVDHLDAVAERLRDPAAGDG